jgi:hypothetical protein
MPSRFKAKARKRPEPGVMNNTEKAYAGVLEAKRRMGEIVGYRYQAVKFRLADNTHYTPDFMITYADGNMEFVEVKGSWKAPHQDDSKVKIKVAASIYWQFAFVSAEVVPKKLGGGWKMTAF